MWNTVTTPFFITTTWFQLMSSESLREEGKEYFRQKKYAQAKEKFTEALKVDEENAILYANRSACNYALQQYVLVHLIL